MSSDLAAPGDALDYATPKRGALWRRRMIVGALFAAGAGVAVVFTAACAYFLEPNLLPH